LIFLKTIYFAFPYFAWTTYHEQAKQRLLDEGNNDHDVETEMMKKIQLLMYNTPRSPHTVFTYVRKRKITTRKLFQEWMHHALTIKKSLVLSKMHRGAQ